MASLLSGLLARQMGKPCMAYQGEVLRRLQAVGANFMPPSPASAALRPFKLPLACMFDLPQAWKVVAAAGVEIFSRTKGEMPRGCLSSQNEKGWNTLRPDDRSQ
jgi:hypothetical protein